MALASAFPEWRSHSKLDHSAYFPSGLRAVRIACLPSNPAPSSIPESEPRTAGRAGINRRWLAAQTLPHLPRPWPAARRSDFASETFTASVYQQPCPGWTGKPQESSLPCSSASRPLTKPPAIPLATTTLTDHPVIPDTGNPIGTPSTPHEASSPA